MIHYEEYYNLNKIKSILLHKKYRSHIILLCLITQSCLTLCNHMDYNPSGPSVLGDSPGKNTGVGCHAFLQGSSQLRD